jgi:hypothetical protein
LVLGNTRLRARALDGASLASCVSVCECFRLRVPAARVSLGSDKVPELMWGES